jgi:hypothetical protein
MKNLPVAKYWLTLKKPSGGGREEAAMTLDTKSFVKTNGFGIPALVS